MRNKNLSIALFFLGLFIFMFLINMWTPESLQDDILYKFKFNIDGSRPTELIRSWGDLLESQYAHWFVKNGRFVPHFLSQLFIGLLGKVLFNVINSIIICMLIYLTSILITGKVNLFYCAISLACLLFLTPIPKETLFWYDGSFNYLWSFVFVLFFLVVLKSIWKEPLKSKYWLLSPLMMLLGNVNEASTIPVCLSLGVYLIANIRTIHKRAIFSFILFFFIGAALNVFAPATFIRIANNTGESTTLATRLAAVAVAVIQSRILWLWLIALIYTYFRHKDLLKEYFYKYWFVALCVPFSFSVYFLSDMHYDRLRFSSEMFSLLGLIACLNIYKIDIKLPKLSYLFLILSFGLLVPITIYAHESYNNYLYCKKQLELPGKTLILTKTDTIPDYINSYIMKHVDYGFKRVWYNACSKNCESNQLIAKYYNKPFVYYFPEDLYNDIKSNPSKYNTLNTIPNCFLYVQEISKSQGVNDVTYELDKYKTDDIPLLLRPIANRISRYSCKTTKPACFNTLRINNKEYLVLFKPQEDMDKRVRKIEIK